LLIKVGTYEDAVRLTADLANLGKDFEIFEIPKKKRSLWDLGDGTEEDPLNSLAQKIQRSSCYRQFNSPGDSGRFAQPALCI
jgi:hypothetical protein